MSEQSAAELMKLIDTYMPTVITGIYHLSHKARQKSREDWTEDDIAVMAAFSAAHNMMWKVTGRYDLNLVEYDFPSVLDLLNVLKRRAAAIDRTLAEFPETHAILGEYEGRVY